ncbi:heterokaryon incompatibility protein-domain-containing protein [Chaetomium fimeti]|uniref:Heterokaryon incompatibility protein-domain-containing protein n=1 Tax=Chaetomium fimeti TaxID=1854472 RepID=A0AAE0HQX5_9PEZI|nr:heterokaryon incompatibility protein-domain-containing protein [Chaetomium fimeti]
MPHGEQKKAAPPTATFEYSLLELDPRQVRLITLSPGVGGEPLACKVEVLEFNSDLHKTYDVLSYAWGDKEDQQTITVEGGAGFEITIRKNLWLALRRIRDRGETGRLWVDAICINQDKKSEEKSQQVERIGDMYKHCRKCIVWLGEFPVSTPPTRGVSKAVELLKMFAECDPRDDSSRESAHALHVFELECFCTKDNRTDVSDDYKDRFEALTTLLNLEWWRRTWVIQELTLPGELDLLVDSESLPYKTLEDAVLRLTRHSLLACCKNHRLGLRGLGFEAVVTIEERLHSMILARQYRLDGKDITFAHLRRRFCGSEASWKRDSFYGLLGIVTKTKLFTPDYKLPLRTAITDATFGCVKLEEDGAELLLGERLFRDQNPYRRLHVPSWVSDACFCTFPPKWALMERRRLGIYSSFATDNSESDKERKAFVGSLTKSKNALLLTKSCQVATIKDLGCILVDEKQWKYVPDILASWMELAGIKHTSWPEASPAKDSQMDVFWRTVINNSTEKDGGSLRYGRPTADGQGSDYSRLRSLWTSLRFVALGRKFCNALTAPGTGAEASIEAIDGSTPVTDNPGLDEQSFPVGMEPPELHDLVVGMDAKMVYHLLACLWERRLFITEGGKIGLAPRDAEKGDEVHIIPGCPAPFILRRLDDPKSSDSNLKLGDWDTDSLPQYMVVGNGFFHGFMGGGIPNVAGVGPLDGDGLPRVAAVPQGIAIH